MPLPKPRPRQRVNLATASVRLQLVASGLSSPVALAWRAGNPSPMYVAEQGGRVVAVANGHIVRTVLRLTVSSGGERGLLGLAFARHGKKLYVYFTDKRGDIRIAEYKMKNGVANVASRRVLMVISHHKFSNHNGGNLVMGPGNLLYIGTGDGGGGGDTLRNGQNLNSLLGKILRIDPRQHGTTALPDPGRQSVRSSAQPQGCDLDVRPAQPVALLVRPQDARHLDR